MKKIGLRYDQQAVQNIISQYESGLSCQKIAEPLQVTRQTIHKILLVNNVKIIKTGKISKMNFQKACEIRHKFATMNQQELAVLFETDQSTVSNILLNKIYPVQLYTQQEIETGIRVYIAK